MVVGAYALIILVGFAGFRKIEDDRAESCQSTKAGRAALRTVIDIATTPSGGPVDLTKIEGFDQLDPSTQAYLSNLSAALTRANMPGQPTLHDRLLAQAPPIDCN